MTESVVSYTVGRGGYRPGAGRKPRPEEARKKQRKICMSDREWQEICRAAEAARLSVSEYIRQRCLPAGE